MSARSICDEIVSTARRVPRAVGRRLHYQLHPRALYWNYLKKCAPTTPVITQLGHDGDLRVRVYPHDVIGRYIFIDGLFEPAACHLVKHFIKAGMTVFDLGANLGQYTLLAGQCVGAGGAVHSFEPSSRMFDELAFNVNLNGFSDRCSLNNVAVSNAAGIAQLTKCAPGDEVYASLGSVDRPQLQDVKSEEVVTIRLDDYMAERNIDHVDFIKIDIEGAELLALQGAEKLLSRPDAAAILIELVDINARGFGYRAIDVWDYLAEFDYKMYAFDRGVRHLTEVERPADFSAQQDLLATKQSPDFWL